MKKARIWVSGGTHRGRTQTDIQTKTSSSQGGPQTLCVRDSYVGPVKKRGREGGRMRNCLENHKEYNRYRLKLRDIVRHTPRET